MPSSSTSKTVDVKKSHVGLTFIRESTIRDKSFTERAPKLGGLVEFYRSPARVQWSPTGTNVPDYPKLAQLWWQNIGDASSGAKSAQEALDALCAAAGEGAGAARARRHPGRHRSEAERGARSGMVEQARPTRPLAPQPSWRTRRKSR